VFVVTDRETRTTLEAMEENQTHLQASIDESCRLMARAQTLLDKHRKEVDEES